MTMDKNAIKEIKEKLTYRIQRAINESIDDEEYFIECATNDIVSIIEKYELF